MTTATNKRLARDAARIINRAAGRGCTVALVTHPDGSAMLAMSWGSAPMPSDLLRKMMPQLTAEVAGLVMARQAKRMAGQRRA
jgi:hypothetical protein